MPSDRVLLAVRIPRDLHRQLKIHAATKGRSISEIVEAAIRRTLGKGVSHA